ncbi:hypothetical protein CANMA_003371 [Candida margitis]|uniref:uncharacterized protein n=1 Tax=Candida margitis TaxID=1775924 RepID=UPI002225C39C|nr:uncharacterized protein CANMA_003371 [Candida margitis]KAI5966125.1 hypothetical protein CANMA_003371 [Candida margitis]
MPVITCSDKVSKVEASLLPMHLQYSGPANTSDYFTLSKTTETQNDGSEIKTAYFRGCRLVAKEVNLKDSNVEGYIINKNEVLQRKLNEEDGTEEVKTVKNYSAAASFDKLTLKAMNDLFIASDEDSDDNAPPLKKVKGIGYNDSSDLDSDSDFEDIPLQPINPQLPSQDGTSEFSIAIQSVDDKQREKLKLSIKDKQRRTSSQYLSVLAYTLHAWQRNKLLSDRKVLKTLKKLLPDSFMKQFRKFKKNSSDEHLVYIIKYLIKWFRKNFKHDSNGLRVLGYLPRNAKRDDYFPNNSKPISTVKDLLSVIKKFQHNRDVGAQIFTSLLRSLGFEARLVFSLPVLSTKKSAKLQPKLNKSILGANKDNDLLYPYFWTELVNPIDPSEIFVIETQCFLEEEKQLKRLKRFSPKRSSTGAFFPVQNQLCQMSMHYVLSFSNANLIIEVSSRYMRDISYRWFNRLDLRTESGRAALLLHSVIRILNSDKQYTVEANRELDNLRAIAMRNYTIPKTLSAMKKSPNFTTQSTLRYNEIIDSSAVPIANKLNGEHCRVYFKNCLIVGKSEQQWKFCGRSIKPDEIDKPIKTVKANPRTIHRKRIFNLNHLSDPELNTLALYSFSQTCPYIKPKVENGVLPRNKYGNIEIFRPNMVPGDCLWLKISGVEVALSKSRVNYVPVVVGFSFKSGSAYPLKNGVIVLKEDEVAAKKIWLSYKGSAKFE